MNINTRIRCRTCTHSFRFEIKASKTVIINEFFVACPRCNSAVRYVDKNKLEAEPESNSMTQTEPINLLEGLTEP